MDMRCHGDSPFVDEPVTMRTFATDVYETLQKNHITIDTVVGHSFGGKVALEMMSMYSLGLKGLPKTAIVLDISFIAVMKGPFISLHDWEHHGRSHDDPYRRCNRCD